MSTTASPTPSSVFAYNTLGPRLVAALNTEPAAQTIVKNLLCNKSLPDTLPKTMLDWMKRFAAFQPLHEELVRGQCRLGPVPATPVALGPLLVWGFQQNWAFSIEWEVLLSHWSAALMDKGPIVSLAHIAHALKVFEPVMHNLAPHQKLRVCNSWRRSATVWGNLKMTRFYNARERQQALLPKQDKGTYVDDLAVAWSILGTLAHSISNFERADRATALTQWYRSVSTSLHTVDIASQIVVVRAWLQSTLPQDVRCRAACLGAWEVLDDAHVRDELLHLLPEHEKQRVDLLPWVSSLDNHIKNSSPKSLVPPSRTYMPHEAALANKRLLQMYCPMLYNLMASGFSERWADPKYIDRLATSIASFTCEEGVSLPANWDIAEHGSNP